MNGVRMLVDLHDNFHFFFFLLQLLTEGFNSIVIWVPSFQ